MDESDVKKNFLMFTANFHIERICKNFLKNKFGKFDEMDHYLVESLANGEF